MIQNMRDLGGLRTKDGKTIRKGMLVRSAQLNQAEADDLTGISAVIDLRMLRERLEEPDRTYGREYRTLPLINETTTGISHEEDTPEDDIPEMDLAVLYAQLMKERAANFREVLTALMTHDFSTGAVLWHCSEGKDRCGMTTALVLEALGVARDQIMEDYLKTNLVNLPKAAKIREQVLATYGPVYADRVYQAYIADERYLQAAWEAMGEDYLRDTLQIGDSLIDAFRKAVLE